jgi:dUTP pyrophosphatase
MPNIKDIDGVLQRQRELFLRKLADYGTADIVEMGADGVVGRIGEKVLRLKNLIHSKTGPAVADESLIDTARDIAGYAIILELVLRGEWDGATEAKVGSAGSYLLIKNHEEGWQGLQRPQKIGDAGFDLVTSKDTHIPPLPAKPVIVPAGISAKIPDGYWAQIVGRSSSANKLGLLVHTAIIDNGYTGQLFACVWNMTDKSVLVEKGTRLAQIILLPLHTPQTFEVPELPQTARGSTGFGSTGS